MAISFAINKKLILLVMSVSIIALSITAFLSFNYAEQILKERTGEQLFGESTIRGDTLRILFESRIEQNQIIATDPMIEILVTDLNQTPEEELQKSIEGKRRDFLTQIQAFQTLIGFSIGFEDVKIIGKNGQIFFSLGRTEKDNFKNDPLFQKGIQSSFVDFEPFQNSKKMIVVSPIFAEDSKIGDEAIGVVISRMRTAAIDNILLNRSGLGESGEIYIVNDNFLMLSESRFMENTIFTKEVDTIAVQKCFNEGIDYEGLYPDYREIPIYGSSYCADDLGFVLLAEIDEAETIQPILTLQERIFETGLLIITGMAIITFIISRTFSKPLIKLKNAANTIASGNFEVRTKITTKDEIGELSQAFDSMAQKLQESIIEIKEKEDVIKQQEDILLQFSDYSEKYCVCMIDIMNSTKITSQLSDSQTSEFYRIFLNSTALIVRNFGGIVVKNIGDALLFYFPIIHSEKELTIKKCLNCCLTLGESHKDIVTKLQKEKLPIFDYRTSATFGIVRIARTSTSSVNDIFGATVNRCAKINRTAPANGLIIGKEFYENAKNLEDYVFKKIESDIVSPEHGYIGYIVSRKQKTDNK
ncbi:MAG: HAMP domain-containing protein [Nitrosopumilus sp.]|nr:HAMP domain-containing protein [Nitrosopumilus sp.]MDH3825475.1 HAMP domain-containing protein [Nitrosopumilus sp.]